MMRNDIDALLNDILASWFRWAKGYQHVGGINSSPMFKNAKTSKGWDSVAEIVDVEIDTTRMASVDFEVMEMEPVHRTILQLQARNLVSGVSVWVSPRLPTDPEERAIVLMEARNRLMHRLLAAGVM